MALSTPQQSTKFIALAVLGMWWSGEHAAAFHVAQLGDSFGAEIQSFDLSKSHSRDEVQLVVQALHKHQLLLFRDQVLQDEDLLRFADFFGGADYLTPGGNSPSKISHGGKIHSMSNLERTNPPSRWHTDQCAQKKPTLLTFLYATTNAGTGVGNTSFADQCHAYEQLDAEMQARILPLHLKHDASRKAGFPPPKKYEDVQGPVHPLVRKHPVTQKLALYLGHESDRTPTLGRPGSHIVEMPDEEGEYLLKQLWTAATQPNGVYTHRWRQNDVVVWDNRALMHMVHPWDHNLRAMKRFVVGAEVPEDSSGHVVSDDGEDGECADEARHLLRIVISATRSGSTALLHCFANNPHVDMAWHQPIKSGYRENGTFSYEVFRGEDTTSEEKRVWVAKETIGGFFRPEASFSPLPGSVFREDSVTVGPWAVSRKSIQRLKPLVLIRDPLQVWNSIKKLNEMSAGVSEYHSPFDYFVESYSVVAEFLFAAKESGLPVFAVTQEMLAAAPQSVLSRICEKFGIPYSDAMVHWTEPYGSKTWFSEEAQERFRSDPRFQRSKEILTNSTHYDYRPSKVNIRDEDKAIIEKQLLPLYAKAAAFAKADFGGIAPEGL